MPSPHQINILVLIVTFIFLGLMFKDRIYGLIAYLCISFTRPGTNFSFLEKISFEMLVAILIILSIIISKENFKKIAISRNNITRNLFFFLVVVNLSMVFAIDFQTAFERNWEFFKVYLFCLMIVSLVKTDRDLRFFLWAFTVLIVWVGYEPVYNYINQTGMIRDRGGMTYAVAETGRASGHVSLGIYLCQGISFLWYLTVSAKNKKMKSLGGFFIFFSITGILISGSRGALVGLAVTFMLISYFSERRYVYLAISGLVFFVAIFSMDSGYVKQMSTILEFGASDSSASSRFDGLRHGIEMMVKRPVLGVGPGCYPVARQSWFGWGLWSHNVYGQLAGDLGLAGIATWGIFVYSYIKECLIARKELDPRSFYFQIFTAILVSNVVCLVLGFFAHTLYGYFWYMSAGIVVVIEDLRRKRSSLSAA